MGFPLMRSPSVSQKQQCHSQNNYMEIEEKKHRDETTTSSHVKRLVHPALMLDN